MKRWGGTIAALAIFGCLLAASSPAAWSQTTRTIKIIVPYPPGGPGDILARLLGEQINRAHGPTVLVENRPGASGRIGTEAAAVEEDDLARRREMRDVALGVNLRLLAVGGRG
jgi:tripartite-type tricarboxylate transporter receptor subunit TctC